MPSLEERMAKVEGILEQMDRRIAEFREDFNARLNHLESRFWWLIGIQISMWVTIILAVLLR